MGDVNTTGEALEAADQRLRESGDAGVFKIREQIAKDIAAIHKVEVTDIVGTYISIKSLQDQADTLTLLLPYTGKTLTQPKAVAGPTEKEAQNLLDSALLQLGGMVTIRHTEHPIKEILTQEETQFIREQLKVKLEIAKIGLVQQNEKLYQLSLADAKEWVVQNFAKNAETNNFLAEIDKFNAIKIRSHFPDISLSLKMLRDITKLRLEADKTMPNAETVKSEHVEKPVIAAKPTETAPPAETPKQVEETPVAQ
jgi:uroporphyrin-3 C-methyltransferase